MWRPGPECREEEEGEGRKEGGGGRTDVLVSVQELCVYVTGEGREVRGAVKAD